MLPGIIGGIVIVVSLIAGFGIKYFFGEVTGEAAESLIDNVVESATGVDLDPIFKLDDKK